MVLIDHALKTKLRALIACLILYLWLQFLESLLWQVSGFLRIKIVLLDWTGSLQVLEQKSFILILACLLVQICSMCFIWKLNSTLIMVEERRPFLRYALLLKNGHRVSLAIQIELLVLQSFLRLLVRVFIFWFIFKWLVAFLSDGLIVYPQIKNCWLVEGLSWLAESIAPWNILGLVVPQVLSQYLPISSRLDPTQIRLLRIWIELDAWLSYPLPWSSWTSIRSLLREISASIADIFLSLVAQICWITHLVICGNAAPIDTLWLSLLIFWSIRFLGTLFKIIICWYQSLPLIYTILGQLSAQ